MTELCAGCGRVPIGKLGLTATTLCRRCVGGKPAGRKRKGVELRVARTVSVDPKTSAAFRNSDVLPGALLDAIVAANGDVPNPELLSRIIAHLRIIP